MLDSDEVWKDLNSFEKAMLLELFVVAGCSKQAMAALVFGDGFTRSQYEEINSHLSLIQRRILNKGYPNKEILKVIRDYFGVKECGEKQ